MQVKNLRSYFRLLALGIASIPTWFLHGSPLKEDEEVILFPTSGNRNITGGWDVPVHAWVFEMEEDSILRKLGRDAIGEILECFEVTEEQTRSETFRERIKWFLVDNERNKRLDILFGGRKLTTPRTSANGHVVFNVPLQEAPARSWLQYSIITAKNDPRKFSAEVQIIPETGLSIISDIDDTIKISEVLDKQALIQNIFFKDYHPTPGMPEYYRQLAEQGAFFHYVSASPWQLYPALRPFMKKHYPKGTISLRHFRIADSSFVKFFLSSQDYKIETIRNIIRRYPQHHFLLIGDSGEKDPEVYAHIHSEFPENIQRILIRKVKGSDLSDERLARVFRDVPARKWQLFELPDEIISEDTEEIQSLR